VSLRATGVALSALALATGCGDSGDDQAGAEPTGTVTAQTATISERPHPLSAADAKVVERAREEVNAYCRKVARARGGGAAPRAGDLERVAASLDELAALAARDPEGEGPDGITARLALGDIAEDLEGSNCSIALVERIDQALAEIP
jgi:hypothetical protein